MNLKGRAIETMKGMHIQIVLGIVEGPGTE